MKSGRNARNVTKAINTYAIPVLTYSFGVIEWNNTELENLERQIRVKMTRNRILHPKSAIERLILPRNEGGRGILNLKWSRDKQVANIRNFFQKMKTKSLLHQAVIEADKAITAARLQETADLKPKNIIEMELIDQWKKKVIHGRYPQEVNDETVNKQASLIWLSDRFLYPQTEGSLMAIQDGVIKTRNYLKYIMKQYNT